MRHMVWKCCLLITMVLAVLPLQAQQPSASISPSSQSSVAQASNPINDKLAQLEPGNAGWQRDVSVSLGKVGDVRLAAGDRAGALAAYEESLAIRRKLAAADPGNAGWQRDVSVSLNKVGDVRVAAGDRVEASCATRIAHNDVGSAEFRLRVLENRADLIEPCHVSANAERCIERIIAEDFT